MNPSHDLDTLARGFAGRKFGELILHHVKRQSPEEVAVSNIATIQGLPVTDDVIEGWIDEVNPRGYLEPFWAQDCGQAFRDLTAEAGEFVQAHGSSPLSDDDQFSMFQVIVLNFAYTAHQQPSFKKYVQKCCGVGFLGRLFN